MNPTKERCLLAATVLLFSGMLLAGDERAAIEDLVASYSELNQFSGSMLVAVDSEPIYRKGVGLANREWKVPNDP